MRETISPFKEKFSVPLLWIFSTVFLSGIFIFAAIPKAEAQGEDGRRYISIIQNAFDFIQRNYVTEVDPEVLFEGAMSGLFNALGDPYSSFLPEKEMAGLNETTQGNFGGLGLYISKPIGEQPGGKPPYVEVAAPIEDTPGWRAGINPGDLIIKINDEYTDVLTMDEVLARLRGEPGVEIKLLIRRGEKLEFPIAITRAIIEVPTVKYAMIGDIGYVRIITFTPMTVDRTVEALNHFKAQNARSIVIDLRNNYGGLLQSAIGVCDLFLNGGLVVTTRSRMNGSNIVYHARQATEVPLTMPIVTLINRGSASASEIVAGALKDRGRAYLVGEKSFGKGSVQQVYNLDTVGFKLTTAHYFTPSDASIDQIGIPPDREVLFPEFSDADMELLNALINANRIPAFVAENPQASAAEVNAFVLRLSEEYRLDISLLRRLIRNEQNRTVIAPVYDLEYDVQLQEAVNILRSGNYSRLMQTAKTLKALQEESEGEEVLAS
ncbi:MAG: S41 family peptidase [Spirochaetaceae bacterium]|jgi:carboxyl-terminal processing protease|nr:S41 family peptidase [Spirochaetaceae bacterium]